MESGFLLDPEEAEEGEGEEENWMTVSVEGSTQMEV